MSPDGRETEAMGSDRTIQPAVPPDQHRFHLLDAMRGIAAILVVPRHAPRELGYVFLTHNSFLAVDFFFCLSGFVVAFSYEPRLSTKLGWKDFAITRMIRLYPVAILGTLLGLLAQLISHSLIGHKTPAVLLIPLVTLLGCLILPFPQNGLFPLDSPMWTLFLELWANFAYGALVRARAAGTWLLSMVCAVAFAGLVAARHRHGTIDLGFTTQTLGIGVARVCFSFFAGVLLYRLYRRKRIPRLYKARALVTSLGLVSLLAAVLVGDWLGASGVGELLVVALLFPLIIFVGAEVAVPGRWTALCAVLGTISYPLYLMHQPYLALCMELQTHLGRVSNPVMGIYLLSLLAFAWLAAERYDAPVRGALSRYVRRSKTRIP